MSIGIADTGTARTPNALHPQPASLLPAAAVAAVPKRETTVELIDAKAQAKERKLAPATLGVFFRILLAVPVLFIVSRYL